MPAFRRLRYLVVAALLFGTVPDRALAGDPAAELAQVFSAYRASYLELNPLEAMFEGDYRYNDRLGDYISPSYRERMLALEQEYVGRLRSIDRAALGADDQLSLDIFSYDREMRLENFRDGHARLDTLMPVSQFFSLPTFVAQLGGGTSAQPFATAADYDNWLRRAGEFPAWVEQAIANMREGMAAGVVLPRVLVERTLPQLAALLVDDPQTSVFMQPVRNMPDTIAAGERERLAAEYARAVQEVLVPAYRRLHDFMAGEYLAQARDSVGIGQLPGGQEWYAYLARMHTTTTLSPAEIHAIGRRQAEQIAREMEAIRSQLGFQGDMQAFLRFLREDPRFFHTDAQSLLDSYRALKTQMDARIDRIFDLRPKADYVIEPIEAFREASAAAAEYMRPAPDGSRPAIFYVNTYKLEARPIWQREALFIHEAVPGHHFQIGIAQDQERLPEFRRFDGPTAYVEGWGLYAETLGTELGFYRDPYQRLGALAMQMWRANRLVVDTGMHAMGWTREQAIEWMLSNTPFSETDMIAEVERYVAIPGQALAYMVGQIKYRELRRRAEQALGGSFDLRAFHRTVLADGAMPLFLLERKIDRWIEERAAAG